MVWASRGANAVERGLRPRVSLPTIQDVISGLVNSVFSIALSVSYAVLIFSGPLAGILPVGIGYGLVAATVTAMVFAAASGIPFAAAGPDSRPVAVLAALAAGVAADLAARGKAAAIGPTVLIGLVAGTLLTGLVLYLLGALRAGRWMRFLPYPVMGGFLAASGWLLMAGSVRVMTGIRLSFGGGCRARTMHWSSLSCWSSWRGISLPASP